MASEKFCLKWNDFSSHISSSLKTIREDKDFFDVTLACNQDQIEAHKLVLSSCSPFFKQILRKHLHQHPLLYLRGVQFRDLVNILNFMYNGEVNVAQDDLTSFLSLAEELQVRGLTQAQDNCSPTHAQDNTKINTDTSRSNQVVSKRKSVLSSNTPTAKYSLSQASDPVDVKNEPYDQTNYKHSGFEGQDQEQGVVAVHDSSDIAGYDGYEEDPGVYEVTVDKGTLTLTLTDRNRLDTDSTEQHVLIYLNLIYSEHILFA